MFGKSFKRQVSRRVVLLFRWVINGPKTTLSAEEKCQEVHKRVMSLVQSPVSMCLTECQIGNKKSDVIKTSREMPQQLAVGLAIASKGLVNMLHGFGMSVEYNRLLRVESRSDRSQCAETHGTKQWTVFTSKHRGRQTRFLCH